VARYPSLAAAWIAVPLFHRYEQSGRSPHSRQSLTAACVTVCNKSVILCHDRWQGPWQLAMNLLQGNGIDAVTTAQNCLQPGLDPVCNDRMLTVQRNLRRYVGVALSALALVTGLSACTPSVTGAARNAGFLVVALAEAPGTLDPTLASSYVGRIIFANMCEKLYDVDEHLNLVPQLADALPDVSADGLTYTIRLRPNIRFNDGTPMDAESLKESLDRHRTNKQSQRSSELRPVSSVDVVDPSTVQLHLSQPFAPLTSILADRAGMVLSPAAIKQYGDNFAQHPVCVGPFSFSSRPSPDEINLVRSQDYYDRDKVTLPGLTFRVVTQPNVRAADLRSGDADIIDRPSPQDVPSLQTDPGLRVDLVTSLGYYGITVNIGNANGTAKPPAAPNSPLAQDVRLRQAFELSLDRDVINKVVFNGAYVPDCSPIPPDSPWKVPVQCTRRDVDQARKLVAETGVPTPIHVGLLAPNDTLHEQLGTIIQAMAKDAGFAVDVEPSEFSTSLDRGKNGQFETFEVGWSGRLDADQNISQQYLPGSSQNYAGSHDPGITGLINEARQTSDDARRKQLYTQLVGKLHDELGIIFLYHERYALGMRKQISGVTFFGDGLIRLKQARMGT
jgi:peptide/nickel transport system substrate-binding protein